MRESRCWSSSVTREKKRERERRERDRERERRERERERESGREKRERERERRERRGRGGGGRDEAVSLNESAIHAGRTLAIGLSLFDAMYWSRLQKRWKCDSLYHHWQENCWYYMSVSSGSASFIQRLTLLPCQPGSPFTPWKVEKVLELGI